MKTCTYSEARQRLAELLNRARRDGQVQIRRRDGQVFVLLPAEPTRAPLDVPGVPALLRRGEILNWIRSGRRDSANRLFDRAASSKTPQSSARKAIRNGE